MLSTYVKLQVALNELLSQEEGQDLIEYSLIIVVIVLVAIATMGTVGARINAIWGEIVTALGGTAAGTGGTGGG